MANEQDLEPLLGTQQNQLAMVVSDGESLDNKATALAAINITLLIFIAQGGLHSQLHSWWQYMLLYGPFNTSIALNIFSILPKPYLGASIDLNKHPEYLQLDSKQLVLQLLADTQLAISRNRSTNRKYRRFWLASLALTIIGTAVLFAILII